jgi:hypothetical protein
MPFNVIAFTSTVIAFFFGSLFNLYYSTDEQIIERSQQTPITRLRSRILALVTRCRRKKQPAVNKDEEGKSQKEERVETMEDEMKEEEGEEKEKEKEKQSSAALRRRVDR